MKGEVVGQVLLILGQLLVAGGIAMWSIPLGCVVAGILLAINGIALGYGVEETPGGDDV